MTKNQSSRGVALVTGAGRRLGAAIATRLGSEGWAVAAHHNASADGARDVVARLRADGGEAEAFRSDLSDLTAAAGLIDAVSEALAPPRAVINCAAIFEPDAVDGFDPDVFARHMTLNVAAPIALAEAAARRTEALDVVEILDQKIRNRSAKNLSYTLSKIALAAAMEIRSRNGERVRVNAVAPGLLLESGPWRGAEFDAMARDNPLRRRPSLEETTAAVSLLLDSPRMRAQTIYVDGGSHLNETRGLFDPI